MCGIAGALGVPEEAARKVVERMRRALAHRGPDDHGTEVLYARKAEHPVVLTHNRLAIIDLSAAGHEPMFYGGRDLALTFNGEIYNFSDIRRELEERGFQFRSRTDAEVILAAYRAWGPDAVQRFRGMFAFAIADVKASEVWLCRDRLGIKPLYLARPATGGLLFASEVRGLLAAGSELVPPRVSPSALESFFAQGMVCGFGSIVERVTLLAPATNLRVDWDGAEIERKRYWSLPFLPAAAEARNGRAKAVAELGEELRRAVRLHLIADVPLGIFLSGGVDSSAVATVASEVRRGGIHTLSVGFDQAEFDETREASELARALGTSHTVLRLTGPELLEDIEQVFSAMDQPTVDGFNTYVVSRAARRAGLTVALSGLGGDELFGGYASFRDVPRAASLRKLIPFSLQIPERTQRLAARVGGRGVAKALELLGRPASTVEAYLLRRELLLPAERRALYNGSGPVNEIDRALQPELSRLSDQNQISVLELSSYMRDMLLRDGDVFSMAVGLELRVPLLDHVFVEGVVRLPGRWKTPDPRPKPLLLDAVGPALSSSIQERPKRGFTFPWGAWLRGPMRSRVEGALHQQDVWRALQFEPSAPARLLRRFEDGDPRVGGLQVIALWALQEYVTRHQLSVSAR
jgi:asparagine synthase (glutamine-hydrolysing)